MRIAVVIPTLNAASGGKWRDLLDAVAVQDTVPVRKIIIDSSSDDATCAMARNCHWECRTISRSEFNHGLTRDRAVRELAASGVDTVIFLSQDAIPLSPGAFSALTEFLWTRPVVGCYGRQCCQDKNSLNYWQRSRCYPLYSAVKTIDDVPYLGLMTPFFSNAFSAWKTQEVIRYGGFPRTDFGEDMLLAAAVLDRGGAVGYCAEAEVLHDHANTSATLFARGMQVGSFHRQNPELLRRFGKRLPGSGSLPPCRIWLQFAVKTAGYLIGRCCGQK